MRAIRWILVVLFGLPAVAAGQAGHQAASHAIIETVQMPAWLERGSRSLPLAPGMEVRNGDRVRTGALARAYLVMAEGSTVKLGENAVLGFYSRSLKPTIDFKGALDVLKGAFRFTTHAMQGTRSQRDVAIRVGTATAGPIPNSGGTDLWGKSDEVRDLILLIEGAIEVRHAGVSVEMSEPLTYFSVPRNAPPQPLARVDPESFKQWARETEVLPGGGAARRGGKWKVLLARVGQQGEALDAYDKARSAGYAAQVGIRPGTKPEMGGQWNYEVMLTQLASEQDAAVVASKIKAQLGFDAVSAQ